MPFVWYILVINFGYNVAFSDISATSFFKPVTIIKFVEEFLNLRDTSRPLFDRDRVKVFCTQWQSR